MLFRRFPMRILRRRLAPIALASTSLHALLVCLPIAGICWQTRHAHAGSDACPMHEPLTAAAPDPIAGGSHHRHHQEAAAEPEAAPPTSRVECGCADDVPPPLTGHASVVSLPVSLHPPVPAAIAIHSIVTDPESPLFDPLSPPPRARRS